MQRPEIAARNTDYVGYSTPNYKAMDYYQKTLSIAKLLYPTEEEMGDVEIFKDPKDF